ncbi:MAG: lipopolysaccharide biosynthesis protein, partial [Chryseobacterium sp.]
VVIGKLFSPMQLGFYNRADTLKQLPVNNLSTALNKVTFPLFSKLKDDNVKLKEVYKKLMKLVVFIIAPVLCLMIVIAQPMIRFLFTDKWLPAVPYFQVLALAGILYPIHAYNLNILKVKGRSDLFLKLEVIKKVLIVVVLVVSLRYSIMGLVWGQVFISVMSFFINTYYTGRILKYGPLAQAFDLLPTILVSAVLAVLFYYINYYFLASYIDFVQILAVSAGYIVLYLIAIKLLKFKEIIYLKELLKR